MYFAKLVHSQTRRCIQNSAIPMMTPMMVASSSTLPGVTVSQTRMMPGAAVEGYNYKVYEEPNIYGSNYPGYTTTDPNMTNMQNSFSRLQRDYRSEPKLMEMNLPNCNLNSSRSDDMGMRKDPPRPYQMQTTYDMNMSNKNNDNGVHNDSRSAQLAREQDLYDNVPESNGYELLPVVSDLIDKNKLYTDMDLSTTITSNSSPLTFDKMPNSNMAVGHKLRDNFESSSVSTGGYDFHTDEQRRGTDNNLVKLSSDNGKNNSTKALVDETEDVPLSSNLLQHAKEVKDLKQEQQKEDISSPAKPEIRKNISYKAVEENAPKMESPKGEEKVLNTPSVVEEPHVPPVSIENIENAIYGELVNSPAEKEKGEQPDITTVPSVLLENLVTQAPTNLETEVSTKEAIDVYKPNTETTNTTTPTEVADNVNYAETYEYNSTTPATNDETASKDDTQYNAYENNTIASEETQGQDEQQYDYSNYDPSQYSYPGYIYDETTGEYKPDPNAPAEQYATDQQYSEGYEQQYQQQDGAYDYNQTYEQPDNLENNVDTATYENYDANLGQEQIATNETAQEDVVESQQVSDQPPTQTEPSSSEQSSADVVAKAPIKPTSILATADKKDTQKNKKRVNFVESSETDESSLDKGGKVQKPNAGNESDFDFSSSSEVGGVAAK